jgi:hypothetical protein
MAPLEKPSSTPEESSYSSPAESSSSPSSPTAPTKDEPASKTKKPRNNCTDCFGCWANWKTLPRDFRWILVGVGLFAVTFLVVFWVVIIVTGKARLKKEKLAKIEIERLNATDGIVQPAPVMVLAAASPHMSLPTPLTTPTITVPVSLATVPARTTFVTKVRGPHSSNGVRYPASPARTGR